MTNSTALIGNDAVVLGLLAVTLGGVFWTSNSANRFCKRFYSVVPPLLLCYFIPAVLNSVGLINGEHSGLYPVARDYLLPTALVLLTMSMDLPAVARLGSKAIVMFLTGTAGVMIGAPVALVVMQAVSPDVVSGDVWRGMATLAASWIGGGANQAAMKEAFDVEMNLFGRFVAVDVIVASIWMAVLLWMAGRANAIDARTGADTSALDELRGRIEKYQAEHARIPSLADLMIILGVGLGSTGIAHALSDVITPWLTVNAPYLDRLSLTSGFLWVVMLATTAGVVLSFTRARALEGAGASKVGSAMLYVLVATIGMNMDITAVATAPALFLLGVIWISVHAGLMLLVAKLIRAPVFYMAVGSQANIGGAASAPVVAAAFYPSLAPVGVLLAVVGYALGTYAGWVTGQILRVIAQ